MQMAVRSKGECQAVSLSSQALSVSHNMSDITEWAFP